MKVIKAAACVVVLSGATAAAAVFASSPDDQTTTRRAQRPSVAIATGGGRLGISVRDVQDADLKTARLPSLAGALVDEVSEESAGAKAGIREGDVIVEFDGERVRSARQLTRLVQETADGRRVPAVVVRDGQRVTLTVEPRQRGGSAFDGLRGLEEWGRDFKIEVPVHPVPMPRSDVPTPPAAVWRMDDFLFSGGSGRLGLTVDSLTPQLAEYFGTKHGVLVTSVRGDSAAAKAGIKAGDVITKVNGSDIDDPPELRRRLQALEAEDEFTIEVMRDRKLQTLKGKFEQPVRRRTVRTVI